MIAVWRKSIITIAGIVVGLGLYWGIGSILAKSQPTEVNIKKIEVVTAPPGTRQQSLIIDVQSPPATNCTRMSQQLLYQDSMVDGHKHRTYFPISSALNGKGFSGSVLDYSLVLALPPLSPGNYEFIQRSSYICEWASGFIMRRIAYQTEPRLVVIGESPGGTASEFHNIPEQKTSHE